MIACLNVIQHILGKLVDGLPITFHTDAVILARACTCNAWVTQSEHSIQYKLQNVLGCNLNFSTLTSQNLCLRQNAAPTTG